MATRPKRFALIMAILGVIALIYVTRPPTLGPGDIFPYGEIRIGIDPGNPPFAFADDTGVSGIEIDLGDAIAAEIGLPVRFVSMSYDGLYDSLKANQTDIVIATLTNEAQRSGDVLYSMPYFNAGLVLISQAEMPLSSMAELSGYSLAYEFGSEADSVARRWLRRITPFTAQPYQLPAHALDAVRLQQADAALVDAVSARLYFRQHNWQPNLIYITDHWYAVAVPVAQTARLQYINHALQTLHDNGMLDNIIATWL